MTKGAELFTREFLWEELINKKIPVMQLALQCNVSKHTIIRKCKDVGIHSDVRYHNTFKQEDYTNREFGKLKALYLGENDAHGKTRWMCECECGHRKLINTASLKRNLTTTCGFCARKNFLGYEDISGSNFRRIEESAHKRGYEFKITPEYVWQIYLSQNKKCALSGVDLVFIRNQDKGSRQTASVDRINNSLGYIEGNIQIIHKKLQMVKNSMTMDELRLWCKLMYNHMELGNND